jgi:hypothetical protein
MTATQNRGIVDVDGEPVDFAPLYAEAVPRVLRMLCIPGFRQPERTSPRGFDGATLGKPWTPPASPESR